MAKLGVIATTRQAQFKDGRRLAFAEFGDPDGKPVFFFHGLPGCRLYRHPDDALTASLGIRLITIDRPGLGLSSLQPGRTLLDWPDDVSAVADVLDIGSFAVIGHSSGGPYAAACAHNLSHRVTKASIVAGLPAVSEPDRLAQLDTPLKRLYRTVQKAPWLVRIVLRIFWRFHASHPDHHRLVRSLLKSMPEQDQRIFSQPELMEMMVSIVEELQCSGWEGYAEELCVLARSWGFTLKDISVPVEIWWGDADNMIPRQIARDMTEIIPQSSLNIVPNAGHYVIFSHWQAILSELVQ